jgi:Glycosyl hydrolases family 39
VVKVISSPSSGTLGIYPTTAAVYSGSQQIFQAQLSLVPDGHSTTFSIDGVVGGSGSSGTITNEGVYTAPNSAGKHTVTVKDNSLGTTASGSVTVFSTVAVDFGSRSGTQHVVPAHLFGAERMNSMHNTADLDLVKAAGFNYARMYAGIAQVFANSSTPSWGAIDGAVQSVGANGTHIMLQVYQSPKWLQPSPNSCGTANAANALPTDFEQWAGLAVQLVKHMDTKYPGIVTDYEIWNEPNTTALCATSANKMNDYINLYKTAAPLMRAQIKADNSTARVGGPSTAGMQSAWVNAMLADPTASENIDFMSYHDYMFSSSQLGAQWDTYNGVTSVYQKTQNTGNGPMDVYLYATRLIAAGKQPQGKNLPIYNTEYNLNWDYAKNCCSNDFTYSPVWNALYISDVLNSVYVGAPNTPQHMVYFAATAPPFCLVGTIDTNMDCAYPSGSSPRPYPQYFLYQLLGGTSYLGLQNGGFMAQSIAPGTLGNGLVVTAFYTTNLDAVVLSNPTGETLSNVPVNISNTGMTSASGTLYQIVNGESIESSSLSLQSTGGTSYSTSVTLSPYSVQAISIHH